MQTIQMVNFFNVYYENVYRNGHYLNCKYLLQQFLFRVKEYVPVRSCSFVYR